MKKALIFSTLAIGLSIPAFAAGTLVAGSAFNNNPGTPSALTGEGEGSLDLVGGTYNFSDLTLPTIDKNATSGFSIGFHLNWTEIPADKDVMVLTFDCVSHTDNTTAYNDVQLKLEVTSNGGIKLWPMNRNANTTIDDNTFRLWNSGYGTTILNDNSITTNDWAHVGLTFEKGTLTTYLDGVVASTLTIKLPWPDTAEKGSYTLTDVSSFLGTMTDGSAPTSGHVYIDNVAIYNGVLTATEMQNLSQNIAPSAYPVAAIPEPTTATLSLLALAGLAARRRRK